MSYIINGKNNSLRQLVAMRRHPDAGTVRSGYSNNYRKLGDFHDGIYDFDEHVVPYSKSACNTNCEIMFIAQDWASEDFMMRGPDFEQAQHGHDKKLPFNKLFFRILDEIFNMKFSDTYSTDAFVFIKPGKMDAKIPAKDMCRSSLQYALPQIDIIKPKLVICMGGSPYNGIRRALGMKSVKVKDALGEMFSYGQTRIMIGTHLGSNVTSRIGGHEGQFRIWGDLHDKFRKI